MKKQKGCMHKELVSFLKDVKATGEKYLVFFADYKFLKAWKEVFRDLTIWKEVSGKKN